MERGTDRELQQVSERWEAMERQRAVATRRLGAITLVAGGLLLLALAVGGGVCFTTARGGLADCAPLTHPPFEGLLLVLGIAAVGWGLWRYWRAGVE